MSDLTKIEWADATWNPVTGCEKVSPGCDHCYALTLAERFRGTPGHYFEHGFDVQLRPEKLDQPLRWKRPRRIFVNSMSDLFHQDIPDEYIAKVFAIMALAPQHTFQVLTKRHGRMRSLLTSSFQWLVWDAMLDLSDAFHNGDIEVPWPLPNVWLGVSVENQQWADIRIPALLDTPAAVRFLSCEPLLGPVDLLGQAGTGCEGAGPAITHATVSNRTDYGTGIGYDCDHQVGIDWVIVGGESGRGARPMHPDWARSLRDQCQAADVSFLFKQWGAWVETLNGTTIVHLDGEVTTRRIPLPSGAVRVSRVGKHAAGRELDGRTWDEYPEPE